MRYRHDDIINIIVMFRNPLIVVDVVGESRGNDDDNRSIMKYNCILIIIIAGRWTIVNFIVGLTDTHHYINNIMFVHFSMTTVTTIDTNRDKKTLYK